MGYYIRYEGGRGLISSHEQYSWALRHATSRAARARENVVIVLRFHGPYAIVRPDGSVSRPPQGYQG